MYRGYILGAMFSAAITVAAAQTPPSDPSAGQAAPPAKPSQKSHGGKPVDKDANASAPAPSIDRSVLPPPQGGDTIYMKGAGGSQGTVLTGVQIVRETPKNIEVQMIEGEPPLLIPRTQVDHIDYDDIDPVRDKLRERLFPQPKEVTIASGERVTSELRDKLMAPISAEKKSYKDLDFVSILDDVKSATKVNLEIDPSIQSKNAVQRRWTYELAPETTLMTFLRTDLIKKFDYVEVVFESDSIIVMTKDAAKKRAAAAAEKKTDAPTAENEAKPAGEKKPDDAPKSPATAPAPK